MKQEIVMELDADFTEEDYVLDADFGASEAHLTSGMIDGVNMGGVTSYKELLDKPSINGTTLEDNYDEIDPTVPKWAKADTKPTYTAEEVGAMSMDDEMSFTDIKEIWDSIFNKE